MAPEDAFFLGSDSDKLCDQCVIKMLGIAGQEALT